MIRESLVLASSSPRRRQLLEMLGIPIQVVAPNIPEVRRPVETPIDYVERLAREKARSVPVRWCLGPTRRSSFEIRVSPTFVFRCRGNRFVRGSNFPMVPTSRCR